MDPKDKNNEANIPPMQLDENSRFKFRCHPGVPCFTQCCRGINIMLTPYDIVRMKNRLQISSSEFLAIYTKPELLEKTGSEMKIKRIQRGESVLLPLPDVTLRAGDQLVLEDTPAQLKEYEQVLGAQLFSGERAVDEEHPLQAKDQQLAEIVVVQGSPLVNRTLNASRFTDRYQLATLALAQAGRKARIEFLIEKQKLSGLSEDEKSELRALY